MAGIAGDHTFSLRLERDIHGVRFRLGTPSFYRDWFAEFKYRTAIYRDTIDKWEV